MLSSSSTFEIIQLVLHRGYFLVSGLVAISLYYKVLYPVVWHGIGGGS